MYNLQMINENLKVSPIRNIKNMNVELPIVIENDIIEKNENDFKILLEKLQKPLKVVLMGEVKSGKSTLLNALAGGVVSPVGITETTASIIEVHHDSEEQATIKKKDHSCIKGSAQEIFSTLMEEKNNQTFFEQCEVVELGINLPNLKKITIVDTPGLATITEENENRTYTYIQEADVILWVLNGRYLGQSDVNEALISMAKLGKPIIAIINKIDQLQDDSEELIEYVMDELDLYLKEVFAISAQQAFDALTKEDEKLLETSKFNKLVNYLEKELEAKAQKVQDESIESSINALLKSEINVHYSYKESIDLLLEQIEKNMSRLNYYNSSITDEFTQKINFWFSQELLKEEESALIELINRGQQEKLEEIQQQIFGDGSCATNNYIISQIEMFKENLTIELKSTWQKALQDLEKDLLDGLKSLSNDENVIYETYEKNTAYNLESNIDMVSDGLAGAATGGLTGGLIGGGIGTALASYLAVLGPEAAAVTFVGASSALLLPAAIIGGIGGIAYGVKNFSSNKSEIEERRKMLQGDINNLRINIKEQVCENLIKELKKVNDGIVNKLEQEFSKKMCNNYSASDLQVFKLKLETYVEDLKVLINT